MKPRETPYRRLPGRSFNLMHWDTAWIADDHVLAVRAMPGGDEYRRFFFRDIEAIIVRPTRARMWINVVLAVLGFSSLYPVVFLMSSQPWDRAFAYTAVFAIVPLVVAVINTARGATCEVRIQTAVQAERVMAWSRTRRAQQVLMQVRPLILAAQQPVSDAETPAAPAAP